MTADELLALVREYGNSCWLHFAEDASQALVRIDAEVRRLHAENERLRAAALAERERCAKVADEEVEIPCPEGILGCEVLHLRRRDASEIAAAIRGRAAP